ncbi:hypothetical protein [Qipengyuania sp.]|uniref:hypothetical protein n=1 Tax=Qipengyuania sp. TaxID=2004515 RepID=UPI003736635D
MPLWFFPALIGLCATATLIAGIWLLLHLRDVIGLFSASRSNDFVRGPGRKQASGGAIWLAIIIFNAGWIASLLIWIFVIGGEANAVTDARI